MPRPRVRTAFEPRSNVPLLGIFILIVDLETRFEIFWIFGKEETGVLERIKVIKRRFVSNPFRVFCFNQGTTIGNISSISLEKLFVSYL